MRTRGDLLRSCISFALIGAVKVIRGLRHGISDEERHAVAEAAVSRLKKYGDPWKLDEELPHTSIQGHGMPSDWQNPNPKKE